MRTASGKSMRRGVSAVAMALVVFAAFVGAALAASLNFVEPASSPEPVAAGPDSVAAADLDGDGDQDLAVLSDTVTILKNKGTGNFVEPASSPVGGLGSFPTAIVAADLDGDADRDLAIANQGSDDVTILRNSGSGKFTQPASSPEAVGDTPAALDAADLDGDSDRDLAVANAFSDNVTILKNRGNGNFTEPASSPVAAPTKPLAVAAADLDGDGDRDLAVAEQQSANVRILLNNGAGKFTEAASSPEAAGTFPEAIAAANLDGDSDLDLAVPNALTPNGLVTILKNNGAANFAEPASSPEAAGNFPVSIAAADFDLDTDRDLAVVNRLSDNVTILGNKGTGNFFEPASSPEAVGTTPTSVAAADFDGDGDPDLAVTNGNSSSVTILRNR